MLLDKLLAHPLTRGIDLDDPQLTSLRRRIIKDKRFLREIYVEWYERIVDALPQGNGPVLELGSGAGFLKDFVRELICSEVFLCDGADVVLDAAQLPCSNDSLRAIVMTDVLHHIPNVRSFFAEATRCVRRGGVIAMIEPWVSSWSRFVYTRFHHEPFDVDADWEFPDTGPLSSANGALPWILFARDYQKFRREFPEWQLKVMEPMMPLRYLVSGGVSMRTLMPGWTHGCWRAAENFVGSWMNVGAMFAYIVLERGACGQDVLEERPSITY